MVLAVFPGYYNQETHHGNVKSLQITMKTTSLEVVGENNRRVSVVILNASNGTVYVGNKDDVDNANGFPLPAGVPLMFFTNCAIYAKGASGGELVGYIEEYLY